MPRIAVLVLATLLSQAALAASPLQPPKEKEKWSSLRADEFHFVSNASPAKTLDIARDLLRMRAAIGQVTSLTVRSALPTTVFIFSNERSFAGYRDAVMQRDAADIIGVFAHSGAGNFILIRADVEEIDRTVYHELTHYFVQNTSTGSLPVWIGEGIAEYYSTFRTWGSSVHVGRPVVEHVQWLRQGKFIPLPELFATTAQSPLYNEGDRRGAFYSQSWALFHYLMSDDGRRAKFSQFLSLLRAQKSPDEAFRTAFAMEYADLEKELRGYVRRSTFAYMAYPLGDIAVDEPPKPEPMAHGDVLFELGHLLSHTDRRNGTHAEELLRASLAASPGNAAAHVDLARVLDSAGRRAEADVEYNAAMNLGSRDAQVYLLAGLSLIERFNGRSSAEIPAEEFRQARARFQRSTELDPASALAWAGLGATYIAEADRLPGIAALEKSLALAPGNEEAAFHLLQLYASEGRPEDATRLFETSLAHSSDAGMVAHAREALLLAEVRRIESLAREHKAKEASALARSVLARTANESLRQHLAELLRNLDRLIVADTLSEAAAKAYDGNYAEALALVDSVLPSIDDPAMLEQAKELRAEMESKVKKKTKK